MLSPATMAEIVAFVSEESNADRVLDRLAQWALELTGSRNAVFARMNDELGAVELTNGAGADWTEDSKFKPFKVGDREAGGIVAYVAAKGAHFVTGNVLDEPLYRVLFPSSRSELATPIRDRHGRTRAVLNVESDEPDRYGPEEVSICAILGDLAGLALRREEIERREEALIQIGIVLERAQNEDDLIAKLLAVTANVLRFQSCSIFLYDRFRELFMLRGAIGQLEDRVGTVGYAAGEGCTGWVCQHGEPLRIDNPQTDSRWKGRFLELPSEQVASYLAVPIINRGQTIGAIRVVRRVTDNPHQDNRFTEDDERLLTAIAEQMALGLENIRYIEKALRVERMAAWGELSAKSSHMIGNRVFALKGDVNELGHLLRESRAKDPELKKIHRSLATNVERIEEILQEFRDFVMATQLSLAKADLNFLVKDTVREIFPRRSKVKLQFDLAKDLPEVEVDARKLRRAISEIVENSLSFFEEGLLRVSTRMADDALRRQAKLPSGRRYAAIEIQDEGPGIDADRKGMIFQPFYSSRVKGMGLGLSIVKGILEGHGGNVIEVGKAGKGARFVMLLPVPNRP